ncbi:MAG: RusA family crossover junction endodeoxyribonuclease [Fibromonadales bacterium]|nr:RusA family crossover junction endodeoxyribonuclease [Fibromonadales bacterium]
MHVITIAKIPSVNHYVRHAKGKHFKSKDVTAFEKAVEAQLSQLFPFDSGYPLGIGKEPVKLSITFVLRKDLYRRDLDNMPKVFIDCLAEFYGFNDSRIEKLVLEKSWTKRSTTSLFFGRLYEP